MTDTPPDALPASKEGEAVGTCPSCGGNGVNPEGLLRPDGLLAECEICHGRGTVPITHPPTDAGVSEAREFDHETIDYVLRYGGRCRECADHDGLCPNGLPCDVDDAKTAIRWVLKALNYGIANGFVASPRAIPAGDGVPPDEGEER